MATPISILHPNNTRASAFHVVFSDSTGLQFMGAHAMLTFSILRNPANLGDGAEEQVAVAMTGHALKALVYTAGRVIDHFEKTSGQVISLPDGLEQMTDRAIEGSTLGPSKK
jgi:hypothetical protein